MKIKTVVEILRLLSEKAHRQATELRQQARQPHEIESATNWDRIGHLIDRSVREIERLSSSKDPL